MIHYSWTPCDSWFLLLDNKEVKSSRDWSDSQCFLVLPQPGVILVQLVIFRFHLWHENIKKISDSAGIQTENRFSLCHIVDRHLSPLVNTEDPVGVVAIFANPVQLDGVTPRFVQILIWTEEKRDNVSLAVDESSLILIKNITALLKGTHIKARCLSYQSFHLMVRRDAAGVFGHTLGSHEMD